MTTVLFRIKQNTFVEHLNATWKTYRALAEEAKISIGTITNALRRGCSLSNIEAMGRAMKMPHWLDLVNEDDLASFRAEKDPEFHGWPELESAAKQIGNDLFNGFGANVILTFSGHSWIFASLVMAMSLPRERLLSVPVYIALTMDWKPSAPMPELPGFQSLPGPHSNKTVDQHGFVVLMPENFPKADRDGQRRVAVIDDSITSGVIPLVVNQYLQQQLGYRPGPKGTVKLACCVCNRSATLLTEPDHFAIPTFREDFSYPWGGCIWFPYRPDRVKWPFSLPTTSRTKRR